MPKFKNEEEKKEFIKSCLPIYEGLFGKENAQTILEQQLEAEDPISEEKYQLAERRNKLITSTDKLYTEKYAHFKGYQMDNFQRVVSAMFKPETTPENIKYNEMLATKTMTQEGCIEILQEAVTILGQLTPELFKDAQEDPSVFDKNFAAFQVGFVAFNVINCLDQFEQKLIKQKLPKEEFYKYFPEDVVRLMETNKRFYEEFSTFKAEINANTSEYLYAIPELNDAKHINDLVVSSMSLQPPYNLEVSNYLGFVKTIKEQRTFIDVNEFNKRPGEMTPEEKKKSSQEEKDQEAATIKTIKFFNPDQSKKCKGFFESIQARMAKESRNYNDIIVKNMRNKIAVKNQFSYASFKDVPFNSNNRDNRKAVADRTDSMLEAAVKFNTSSFWYDADKLNKILKNRSIWRHYNPHYIEMLKSMKAILEIAPRNVKSVLGYNKDIREKLKLELEKLDQAACSYLKEKYKDDKAFSKRALNRIDVARMVTTFVSSTKMGMFFADNNDLIKAINENSINKNSINEKSKNEKSINKNSMFTKDAVTRKYNDAITDYQTNPGLDTFVKVRTWNNVIKKMGKAEGLPEYTVEPMLDIKKTMPRYKHIYDFSDKLQDALKKNDYDNAAKIYEEAKTAYDEQKKVKTQNNEAKPADNNQEPKPAVQVPNA